MLNLLKKWQARSESSPDQTISPAMSDLVANLHYEIVPMSSIEQAVDDLPPGADVSVTCSPVRGIVATQGYTDRLATLGHHPVPHLAARLVRGPDHTAQLAAWLRAHEVRDVFVIAGDAPEPLGPYEGALPFIRDLLAADPGVERIGIAGYPDGHSMIENGVLDTQLHAKQAALIPS